MSKGLPDTSVTASRNALKIRMMSLSADIRAAKARGDGLARLEEERQRVWVEWLWTFSIYDPFGPRYMADRFKWQPDDMTAWSKSYVQCPHCNAAPESLQADSDVLPLIFAPVFVRPSTENPQDDLQDVVHFCSQCGETWQATWDGQIVEAKAQTSIERRPFDKNP